MPPNGTTSRILLVKSDRPVADSLIQALARAGFEITTVSTRAAALAAAQAMPPDLALIDLVPGGEGSAICDELHRRRGMPVVMLAGSVDAADRDTWSDGAEDYLFETMTAAETIGRVRAVLRRALTADEGGGRISVGPLTIDPLARHAALDGSHVQLTNKELDLLVRLARSAGQTVARDRLMADVWGPNWFGSTKTLDVHIGMLRRKLGEAHGHPRFVHTVRGVGFRIADDVREVIASG